MHERTAELEQLVVALRGELEEQQRTASELRAVNSELEKRVRDLSVALDVADQELAAFAYTVSHDLRAPLQGVLGFTQILEEDFGDRLQPDGREALARVEAAGRRMASMIEDLLRVSRVSTADLRKVEVDLSSLAREAVAKLRRAEPDREVAVSIEEGMAARADLVLARILVQELIGNAWKFTAGRSPAVIRMFGKEVDRQTKWVVDDNGVGFDMARVAGLFRPFQRLHRRADFPGNGIGLAVAHRIVARHGGAITVRGEVDQGAEATFSL
jgi:light-regulated signal transduction histidine kinase (bacteriophytochrome)